MTTGRLAATHALAPALEAYERAATPFDRVHAAESVHAALAEGPVAPVARALTLFTAPAVARDVLGPLGAMLAPYVVLESTALLVQCFDGAAVRTVLWNPVEAARIVRTPPFAAVQHGAGRLARALSLHAQPGADSQLGLLGLSPDAVDFVAFPTLDGVDPSVLLARYPRARLLVPDAEWSRWSAPSDAEAPWLARGHEVDRTRVDAFATATSPGDGVALLVTGGLRAAHVALAVRTAVGVLVATANTFAPDGFAPHASRFDRLARHARAHGARFAPAFPARSTGDARERAMAIEQALCDRLPAAPTFPLVLPALQVSGSVFAPGTRAIQRCEHVAFGTVLAERAGP